MAFIAYATVALFIGCVDAIFGLETDHMGTVIDLGDSKLEQLLQNLKPSTGYCLMADIVGSTALKDRDVCEWIRFLANTFNNIRAWTDARFLKTVGDMLMFWFPDAQFHATISPLSLIQGLNDMSRHRANDLYLPVKAAATRCSEAYEISFMRAGGDVYGKDIDLTARLLKIASEGEIVMNHDFYQAVQNEYQVCGNKDEFQIVGRIERPWTMRFKGFLNPVRVFKARTHHA